MAVPDGIIPSRSLHERIVRSVRRTESALVPRRGRTVEPPRVKGAHHNWVRITSETLTGDGHYPGLWCQFNAADNSFTDGEEIWVREVNGGKLKTGFYYLARLEGPFDDEVSIYGVVWPYGISATLAAALAGGTTSSTSVAPDGYFVQATLTAAGAPTFTVPEGTLIHNTVDNKLYLSLGAGAFVQVVTPGVTTVGQILFTTTGSLSVAPTGYLTVSNVTTTGTPTYTVAEGSFAWNSVDNKLWISQGGGVHVQVVTADGTPTVGQVTFPTTGSLSVAPTGYLTLPLVTTTGTPTMTLAEGTLVWNSVDNKLWMSLGGGSFQDLTAGGGISGLTTDVLTKATSSTTIGDSSVSDDGSTVDLAPSTSVTVTIGGNTNLNISSADANIGRNGASNVRMEGNLVALRYSGGAGAIAHVDSTGFKYNNLGNSKAVVTNGSGYFAALSPAANIPPVTGTADATYDAGEATIINDLVTAVNSIIAAIEAAFISTP